MFAASKTDNVSSAANYIEDVFSTYLYTGNGSTQTITNGIDLSGKGGMVWIGRRNTTNFNVVTDTVRGANFALNTYLTDAQSNPSLNWTFNSDGFSQNNSFGGWNASGSSYCAWTFRKQAKFFDVVTYTGTGPGTGANEQQVSHNLGSKPGAIIIKRTDSTGDWWFFTDVIDGSNDFGYLNKTDAFGNSGNNVPTSTVFNVGGVLNTSGGTYVAYLFAHNAGGFGPAGSDNVISCGSFTTDGSENSTTNLGYEPQWLLIKKTSAAQDWYLADNMRGLNVAGQDDAFLYPNLSSAEGLNNRIGITSTGFTTSAFGASSTFIYIAIRRGPMKTPTSGTSVFYPLAVAQADSLSTSTVPFPPDLVNTFSRNGTNRTSIYNLFQFVDRLRSLGVPSDTHSGATEGRSLISSATDSEYSTGGYVQLRADGINITRSTGWNSASYGNWINYFWRRAPGFFDVVCYTGTGANRTITHNLGVAPELMIVKRRDTAADWWVYDAVTGNTKYQVLNSAATPVTSSTAWNNTTPTSSVFSIGTGTPVNASGGTYVAYLFATLAGVSKVGSFTNTGSTINVECGFTNGARFILLKRTNSTGDWFVYDTARGINAGTDPGIAINSSAVEYQITDDIDAYSGGFTLNGANWNQADYIFLAIA